MEIGLLKFLYCWVINLRRAINRGPNLFRDNESPEIVQLVNEVSALVAYNSHPVTFHKIIDGILDINHYVVDGDCWYTCNKATEEIEGQTSCVDNPGTLCNCPRDYYVLKLLNILKAVWNR